MFGANVWYKSCGINNLPTQYESCYLLTGEEKELDYYNTLISTIAVLYRRNKSFNSTPLIREVFCEEQRNNDSGDLEELAQTFNYFFDQASNRRIVFGRFWESTYCASIHDVDLVGLEKYMDTAEHYATLVLQKAKGEPSTPFIKKLGNHNK